LEITSCFSYNPAAFADANGKLACELLPSDKYNNSDKFIYSLTFNHFSIPVGANLFVPCYQLTVVGFSRTGGAPLRKFTGTSLPNSKVGFKFKVVQ